MSQGNLYIVSAPSGAGKSSLIAALLERDSGSPKMVSISHPPASPWRARWCALLFCIKR